jgi:hypothetical protein
MRPQLLNGYPHGSFQNPLQNYILPRHVAEDFLHWRARCFCIFVHRRASANLGSPGPPTMGVGGVVCGVGEWGNDVAGRTVTLKI